MDWDVIAIYIVVILIGTAFIVGVIGLLTESPESNDVYINVLSNVTDKYDTSTTTFSVISNGKTTTMVPITSYSYYITTQYGNISVSSGEYNLIEKGDTVVLKENVNQSVFNYVCKITNIN